MRVGRVGGSSNSSARKERDKDQLRINREITVPQVRVIGDDGKMLGIFSAYDAVRLAEEKGLDLIEIAPQAQPPTCRIMDYGKWKYENKKKAASARKNQVVVTVKEIQLRPRTEQHDLDVKIKHARRFLLEGDKVKINLRFHGREMAHQELGMGVLEKLTQSLADIAITETSPKKEGRQMFVLLAPDPLKIKEYKEKHAKELKQQATLPDEPEKVETETSDLD